MYSLDYEALRVEHREAINYASAWGFTIYCRIVPILGRSKAGETANKVYSKILEQEGVPCQKNQ